MPYVPSCKILDGSSAEWFTTPSRKEPLLETHGLPVHPKEIKKAWREHKVTVDHAGKARRSAGRLPLSGRARTQEGLVKLAQIALLLPRSGLVQGRICRSLALRVGDEATILCDNGRLRQAPGSSYPLLVTGKARGRNLSVTRLSTEVDDTA